MLSSLFRNRSIYRINIIGILLLVFFIIAFAVMVIWREYMGLQDELAQLEQEYFQNQKESIKMETERALRYIRYKHQKEGDKVDQKEMQEQIVDAIEQMRNERGGTGYVFIYTFDGVNIADPILKQNAGRNLIGFEDPNGKKVIAELIEVSQQEEGGYVQYVWNKPIVNTPAPKISYAKAYTPWRWMVGSGVYLDSVQEIVNQKKQQHRRAIIEFVFQVLLLASAVLGVAVFVMNRFMRLVSGEVQEFVNFFDNAASSRQQIDSEKLNFLEFRRISQHANAMTAELNAKTLALEDLNQNLEAKVEKKTEKIRIQTEKLEGTIEAQDRFVKNAIHEIYTPINIIFANVELLTLQLKESRHLQKIGAAAKTIHNVYSDLSYLIKKDRTHYEKELIDLSTFLEERLVYFEDLAWGNGLAFEVQIQKDVQVFFNLIELQRMVDNTLTNAVKYSVAEEKIQVILRQEDQVVLAITNKANKDIAHPERIFERYYREDEARGGFGLGLSIVSGICEKNRVKCQVSSQDHVVTFSYHFPVTPKEEK